MFERLVDMIAPDYCCGCGKIGAIVCESCFYDIVDEPFSQCISCLKPTGADGICSNCLMPYQKAWVVGWRQETLQRLTDISKFDSVRRACFAQARMLDSILPKLPPNCVLVPVPTTYPHIRRRGYGHAELVAKRLAKLRKLPCRPVLRRSKHSVQHGSSRRDRMEQAKHAYAAVTQLDPKSTYLLIDDVFTTGATARYATQALRDAGARTVWLAITTRQPLD